MKLRRSCIATVSLGGILIEKLHAAALAGFQGIELLESDLHSFGGSNRDIRKLAEDNGLHIDMFQPFRDFEGMPIDMRHQLFDRAERVFDIMEELGTELLLICSNVDERATGDRPRLIDDFGELAERAARRDLRIGYEALAWARHVRRWEEAWDIVTHVEKKSFGLVVDSFHTLALGTGLCGLSTLNPQRIFFVQLADAYPRTSDLRHWSRHFRALPGKGTLDVCGFLREVIACGYEGVFSLEIFNDDLAAVPPTLIAREAIESLECLWTNATEGRTFRS
jgi:3-dehydroshikimate dehydratase